MIVKILSKYDLKTSSQHEIHIKHVLYSLFLVLFLNFESTPNDRFSEKLVNGRFYSQRLCQKSEEVYFFILLTSEIDLKQIGR